MKHTDGTAKNSNEEERTVQVNSKSIDTTAKRKHRTIRAFVKVRGKDQYVSNPRLAR